MVKAGVVLQCAVISVEDHGYTLDTGVRGVTAAFLPTKELPTGGFKRFLIQILKAIIMYAI